MPDLHIGVDGVKNRLLPLLRIVLGLNNRVDIIVVGEIVTARADQI